jgi:hypothetical protein
VAKVGTSKAGGTISQQAAVHPWLAADAHGYKQTNTSFGRGGRIRDRLNIFYQYAFLVSVILFSPPLFEM